MTTQQIKQRTIPTPWIEYNPHDDDIDAYLYREFIDDLQTLVDECAYKTQNWHVIARNINWRGTGGEAYLHISEVKSDLLRHITPNSDWSACVFKDGRTIRITLYHHDCPTGSQYTLVPTRKQNT